MNGGSLHACSLLQSRRPRSFRCLAVPRRYTNTTHTPHTAMTNASPAVLVVEDNAETQLLLEHILSSRYEATIVASVDAAIEACQKTVFQLLLMDINLGEERTGTDLLHTLRKPPHNVTAPALALTAYAMPGDQKRFEQEGFDAYVSKPFSQNDLLDAMQHCLATAS